MKKYCSAVMLLVVLSIFTTSNVSATSITYEFSGSLYDMWEHDDSTGTNTHVSQSDLFDDLFSVGDTFTGRFTYETESFPHGLYDTYAVYLYALKDFQVNINDFSFSNLGTGSVLTGNNRDGIISSYYDSFYISECHHIGDIFYDSILFFMDRSASFTDDILIPENLDLTAFDNSNHLNMAFLDRVSDDQLHLTGTLETLTRLAPVPEPSTILLFGIGILGVAGVSRKK